MTSQNFPTYYSECFELVVHRKTVYCAGLSSFASSVNLRSLTRSEYVMHHSSTNNLYLCAEGLRSVLPHKP